MFDRVLIVEINKISITLRKDLKKFPYSLKWYHWFVFDISIKNISYSYDHEYWPWLGLKGPLDNVSRVS